MANVVYSKGQYLVFTGQVTTGATLYAMLVTTGYTANMDHNLVDDGTTSCPADYEIAVSGYARAAIAINGIYEDDTNDMAYLDVADTTWGNLSAGATIGSAVAFRYSTAETSSDTGQSLLTCYGLTATPCNGSPISVQWATTSDGGFLRLGTTSQ